MYDLISTFITIAFGGGMYFVGKAVGRRKGESDTRLKLENPKAICGCKHHHSMHDENGCGHETTERVLVERGQPKTLRTGWDGDNHKVVYENERWETVVTKCPCKRYTGPEPLPLYLP